MLWPGPLPAQTVSASTLQLSGLTNAVLTSGVFPGEGATGGFSSVALGLEASYFLAPNISFGGLFGYQRLSLASDTPDSRPRVSTGYYGPVLHLRRPLDDRSAFVLTASMGGVQAALLNQRVDLGETLTATGLGRYWMAGGGLSVRLVPGATVDVGARYQSSVFRVPGQAIRRSSAGILLSVGFSLYIP